MMRSRGSEAPQALPRLLRHVPPGVASGIFEPGAGGTAAAAAADLGLHLYRWGEVPWRGGRRSAAGSLVALVQQAGLRGRGGAGFPTGSKMAAVAAEGGRPVVVVNGTEGEPASTKDTTLLLHQAHLVLDGAALAAEAIGSRRIVVSCRRSALSFVEEAIRQRECARLDPVRWSATAPPERFVSGEESALVNWINKGVALPTKTPPRPFEKGVAGSPTLVNNAETLAHVALVARFGAKWFRSVGMADDPGSMLATVSGTAGGAGISEWPRGVALGQVLAQAGVAPERLAAVLVGGYSGRWVRGEDAATLRLSASCAGGVPPGAGVIVALGDQHCPLEHVAALARYLASQSAGQCGPCAKGLPAVALAVEAVSRAGVHKQALPLHRWLDQAERRGACHHPDGAVAMLRSALTTLSDEVENHEAGRCHFGARSSTAAGGGSPGATC